jgi:hypothetical protein
VLQRKRFRILVGKVEGKSALRISRRRWDDNKTNLREVGWKGVVWILMAKDRGSGSLLYAQ